jgi:hypothetical protein
MSVRVVDDHTIQVAAKKGGKAAFEEKSTVASDGMTVTETFTSHPSSSDQPVTGSVTLKRAAKGVPGTHAISGSWVAEKVENISDNGLTTALEETADGLKMSAPTGEHYDAKLDGKDYPYEGSNDVNKVAVKRIGPRIIEEIDKRDGEIRGTARMTISPDGHTMTMVAKDHQGRISSFVWVKQ